MYVTILNSPALLNNNLDCLIVFASLLHLQMRLGGLLMCFLCYTNYATDNICNFNGALVVHLCSTHKLCTDRTLQHTFRLLQYHSQKISKISIYHPKDGDRYSFITEWHNGM